MDKFTVFSLMEAINPFFPKETSFAIADAHQFIYYQPSKKIDLKIKPGDKVIEGVR